MLRASTLIGAEILTKVQGLFMILAGCKMVLTRGTGAKSAIVCYVIQAVTVENYYILHSDGRSSNDKRSTAINLLKLLIIALTCIHMQAKQKKIIHGNST